MSDNGDDQVHVVFVGRKPWIYFTSKEAFEQVNHLNGSFHGAYDSYEEAKEAYMEYCHMNGLVPGYVGGHPHASVNVFEKGKRIGMLNAFSGTHVGLIFYYSFRHIMFDPLCLCTTKVPTTLALDTSSAVFIYQECMEKLLKKLCFILKLGQLVFTLHDVTTVNSVQYRRYCVSVEIGTLGDPMVAVEKFAKHEYDAREDAAVLLAEELCNRTGKQIRDYNFYAVQKLQTKVEALKDEHVKLTTQLEILREATNKSKSCSDETL